MVRVLLLLSLLGLILVPAAPFPAAATGQADLTAPGPSSVAPSAIAFVFSDGGDGAYEYAYPALSEHGWNGVAVIPTANVGEPGRMTLEQLTTLNGAGWDISSHLDEGGDPMDMPPEVLYARLLSSRQWLLDQGFARGARTFGPPRHSWQPAVTPLALQAGYEVVIVATDKGGVTPGTLQFSLVSCANSGSLDQIGQAIYHAVHHPGTLLYLSFHNIVAAEPGPGDSDVARLADVINLVVPSGLPVRTLSDLLEAGGEEEAGPLPTAAREEGRAVKGHAAVPVGTEAEGEAPAPVIVVQAPPLEAALCPGATTALELSICNQGGARLQWAAVEEPATPWLSESPAGGKVRSTECTTVTVTFDASGLAPGSYGASLNINSNDPQTPQVTLPVALTVLAPVWDAAFGWLPDPPEAGQEVAFQGSASGVEPIAFAWQFGDGGTGGGAAVSHTFQLGGTYTVTMQASNACGMQEVQQAVDVLAPAIAVSGPPLEATLCPGEKATVNLEVCNVGTAPLHWNAAELPAPPPTGGPRVLLLAADVDSRYGSPIQALLEDTGDLGAVDLFDAYAATPSLQQLAAYDVVVTWSDLWYADPVSTGNVLADYVDAGGKVIHLAFSMVGGNGNLQGRFMDQDYAAMKGGPSFTTSCLGAYDPGDDLMAGVTEVCDSYRAGSSQVTPGSTAVAFWQDGEVLVAAKDDRSVVSIGGYVGYYGQWTGQMPELMHNAVLWLAGGGIYWLSEWPRQGTLQPGACTTVAVQFDAGGLALGSYSGQLAFASNDPATPQVLRTVALTVLPECCEPPDGADFTWDPPEPWAGRDVTFYGLASGSPPPTFSWEFGDGGTGQGQTVVHQYAEAGLYAATLSVSNGCGQQVTTRMVTVARSTVMHVGAFKMRYTQSGTKYAVSASLTIRDRNEAGVWAALVSTRWTLPGGQTSDRSKLTDPKGQVFLSITSQQTGLYQLCVLDLTKEGWTYDPSQNYRTCDVITVP
jgi:PKD repeat protein